MIRKDGYLSQFLKKQNAVGAVTPSSKLLARKLMKMIDFQQAETLVELGGGTGPITREFLKYMRPDARLYVFENNQSFCEKLYELKEQDDRLVVLPFGAEELEGQLREQGVEEVDIILSSIPLTIIDGDIKKKILNGATRMLKPEGTFYQFQYSLQAYRFFKKVFNKVQVKFVPLNFPPAFVYTCKG